MAYLFLINGIEERFEYVTGGYQLVRSKWYLYNKGCVQYKGESKDGSGTIELKGGPFNESQCKEPYQELIYHFIEGECGLQNPNDYYYRQVYLNNVAFEPQRNMWYSYDSIKSHEICLKFIDKVEDTGQSVGNVRLFTGGPYNSCDCKNECHEFLKCGGGISIIAQSVNFINGERELIQGKKYSVNGKSVECYTYNGIIQNSSQSSIDIIDGPFDDCDCKDEPSTEYMLFETCDGTLKFWKERGVFNNYEPDHYYSFGNMKYYYYCNPNDFPDFDFDNLTEEQFHIVINSDKVRLYANCFRFIGYTTEQPDSRYKEYPFQIFKSGKCSDNAHNENNQYCEIFFECLISTCKGEKKHINLSNNIINLLRQKGYVTFKWHNKCYYIIEVVGEENPELPIMDIEHLNGIYPGCTECNNEGKEKKDNTEYYEKVNCEFADAVYNKAMSDRYGVEFCCEKDLQRLTIKKKLLDAGQLQDDIDLCEL